MSQQYISVLRDDGATELGTFSQRVTHYQLWHPNGMRALLRATRQLMATTGATRVQVQHYHDSNNRYGEPDRVVTITKLGESDALRIDGILN